MSNYANQANVSVAQQSHKNKFDLSHSHITTMDFYQPRPILCMEVEPNASVKIDLNTTARLSPMVEPMYGDIKVVNRAFFVPMRTIFHNWNEFITSAPCTDNEGNTIIINTIAIIKPGTFYSLFNKTVNGLAVVDAQNYDFIVTASSQNVGFRLTNKGKSFLNILNSLGYQVDLRNQPGFSNSMSAMPLLAFARICFDWTRNTQYDNQQFLQKFFERLQSNSSTMELSEADLFSILNACYRICYSSDYFVSAWDEPMAPNSGTYADLQFRDPVTGNNVYTGEQGAELDTSTDSISHWGQMFLHKLQDWFTRKQISGSRPLDRYMSEYGVQLEASKLNRCVYLGKQDIPIQISDVMQTSPDISGGTSEAYGVGSYSGRGYANNGDKLCHVSCDEFGYVIVLSYIEPRISYPFGRDRNLYHLHPEDFFTSEFDNLGTQAIRMDELSAGLMYGDKPEGYTPNGIFGFTPRYSEYKVKHDRLTGDFMLRSKNTSLEGWYLTRDLDINKMSEAIIHDLNFTLADPADFNKIFFDQNADFDHFFLRFIFYVDKFSQMKPMYDFYQFEDESRQVRIDVNGTKITD